MPLLKGVYLKITLVVNNSSIITFNSVGAGGNLDVVTATSNSRGVIPLQIASAGAQQGSVDAFGIADNFTLSIAVSWKFQVLVLRLCCVPLCFLTVLYFLARLRNGILGITCEEN